MGFVAALLVPEVALAIATRPRRITRAILGTKALHRSPGVDHRAIDREVIGRQQPAHPSQAHQRRQELARDVRFQQPVAVLGKRRGVPDRRIDVDPDEPPEQQVVVDLLHQLPLRADREERLQQCRAQQLFRRDRRPASRRVKRGKVARQSAQHIVNQRPDRAQRMIRCNPILQPNV